MPKRKPQSPAQVKKGSSEMLVHPHPSKTDPLGSWTGLPTDPDEIPVQDADDL